MSTYGAVPADTGCISSRLELQALLRGFCSFACPEEPSQGLCRPQSWEASYDQPAYRKEQAAVSPTASGHVVCESLQRRRILSRAVVTDRPAKTGD